MQRNISAATATPSKTTIPNVVVDYPNREHQVMDRFVGRTGNECPLWVKRGFNGTKIPSGLTPYALSRSNSRSNKSRSKSRTRSRNRARSTHTTEDDEDVEVEDERDNDGDDDEEADDKDWFERGNASTMSDRLRYHSNVMTHTGPLSYAKHTYSIIDGEEEHQHTEKVIGVRATILYFRHFNVSIKLSQQYALSRKNATQSSSPLLVNQQQLGRTKSLRNDGRTS